MAGRHEVPVDPAAGPVQRFAFELRKLRAEADGITYRALAQRAYYSATTLAQAAGGERLPTLPVALAYAEACGGDPAAWEARWREAVEESAADDSRDDGESLPPYRGLARFETGDSGLFFGREQLTADLVELLRRRRFAAVFGPSGSGKSSLLQAGLIPVLQHAQEPDLRPAAIRILTPGERPEGAGLQLRWPHPGREQRQRSPPVGPRHQPDQKHPADPFPRSSRDVQPGRAHPGRQCGHLRRAVERRFARPGPCDPRHLRGHRHHTHPAGTVPLSA